MLNSLLAFGVFATLMTITPGLDTVLVVRTAAVSGRRPAMAAALGIGAGTLCWAVASALGITALLTASQVAYDVLRWAGAAYLCFLGVRALWRNRRPSTVDSAELTVVKSGVGRAFRTGLATDLLNPKVGVFYLSVLPQFLPRGVSPLLASTAMAVLHDIEGLLWFAGLVFLIGRGARLLSRPGVQRRLDQLAGLVFIGFGLRLAAEGARRQS